MEPEVDSPIPPVEAAVGAPSGPRIEIKLEGFEGPLDLLLHLVRKEKLNIYDIPISHITTQYLEYLELMKSLNVDLASEFIAMAATLIYIKSRMLLPEAFEEDEEDPREELMRRLLEYQLYKEAADQLRGLSQLGRDVFTFGMLEGEIEQLGTFESELDASFFDLLKCYKDVLHRFPKDLLHEIELEPMTIEQKIDQIQVWMREKGEGLLEDLFMLSRNRFDLVLTFIAVLELVRRKAIQAVQHEPFGSVFLRVAGGTGLTGTDPSTLNPTTAAAPSTSPSESGLPS